MAASDEEYRRWANLVACASSNYNILMARRGQDLLRAKSKLEAVKFDVTGDGDLSMEKRTELGVQVEASLAIIRDVMKDQFIHINHGAEAAFQLKHENNEYLSEEESKQLKKIKRDQEERNKKHAQSGIKRPYQAAVQQPQPYFQQQAGQYAAPFLSNIQAAKMASTCLKCGLTGHWHKDFVCPRNQNQTSAVYHNPAAAQQSSATGVTPVSAVPTQMQAAQTQFPAIMYTKQ